MIRTLALAYLLAGCAAGSPAPAGDGVAAGASPPAQAGTAPAPSAATVALAERPSAPPAPSEKPKPVPSGWPTPCPDTTKPYVAGHVLVGFTATPTDAARAKFREAFDVLAERSLLLPGVWVMRVPCEADIPAVAKQMAAWPGVKYAEADAIITLDDPIEGR